MLKRVSAGTFHKLAAGGRAVRGLSGTGLAGLGLGGLGLAALRRPRAVRRLGSLLSSSIHTRGFVLWVAALATGILCVSQHVYSSKLAGEIATLRENREEVEAEIGFLRMEHARLSGRERIEEYAVERLGMRYPEAHEVVRLGPGTRYPGGRWDDGLVQGGAGAVSDG